MSNPNVPPWLLAAIVLAVVMLALVIGLVISFTRNARAIWRDRNQRFNAIQANLEKSANAIADELLSRGERPKE